ncbi:hypothetical protein AKO1_006961 [Acrasis kona]|uniref:Ankyrin repeat domain-containing protein n=1 Tax=Acrasis kona TaxID=1008807 RepID=A0AAW2YTM4_9EUKA
MTLPEPVVAAVESGDVETVTRFVEEGGNINDLYAVTYWDYDHGPEERFGKIFEKAKSIPMIKALAGFKAEQSQDLISKVYNDHGLPLVLYLLDCGYTPNYEHDNSSILTDACYKKDLPAVKELIARGANVKFACRYTGHNLLHSSYNCVDPSNKSHLEIIKIVIKHGADQKGIESHYGGRLPQDFTTKQNYLLIKQKLHPLIK